VRWLGPRDPEGGGTWIGTSEAGVTVALLNGNRGADDADREWVSRGGLVPALMPCPNLAEVEGRLRRLDLSAIRSFRLLAVAAFGSALVGEWDRSSLAIDRDADARIPLISSFFEEELVGEARRAEYERRTRGRALTVEVLHAFHRSTHPSPGPFSVAMQREEASTQSLTHVAVSAEEIVMRYHGARPDLPGPESSTRLDRRPRSADSKTAGRA
jgi:hypothetical protein